MILYHGTPASRAEKIIEEKCISPNADRIYDDGYGDELLKCVTFHNTNVPTTLATTKGYTYLTNSLFYAMYYGNKNAMHFTGDYDERDKEFYVFMVDIPHELLEPDFDEIIMTTSVDPATIKTFTDSLNACKSVRTKAPVKDFKYIKLPTTVNFYDDNSSLVQRIVKFEVARYNPENEYVIKELKELTEALMSKYNWIEC